MICLPVPVWTRALLAAGCVLLLAVAMAPSGSAAALTSTNVEPADKTAGATSTVTVTFTTATTLPIAGKVVVVFPSGFDVSGASGGACPSIDGGLLTTITGQTVTLTRDGLGSLQGAAAETCTIAGIRNPQVSGSTGTYTIRTLTALDVVVDEDTAVAADTIVAAALSGTDVQPASLVAGATSTVTASFTTVNPVPADGKLTVTFPAGFDVSGAASATCSSMDGSFAESVSGQVITITRQGDGSVEAAGAQTCTVAGIRNPQVSGSAGTYSLQTKTAADAVIDEALAVAADTITAASLTATNVEPASLVAGATSTVTVTFTTINPVAADGKLTVTFPAGFEVSGAASGSCSSMDGTFATSVAGQVVTITRQGDGSVEAAGAQTCTAAGIKNPGVSGSAGTYALRTLSAADAAIDEALAVAADTLVAATLTATDVQPASLVAGATPTVTATFTTINPLAADGKITVTFPAGFDVSGAASGTCTSMDGTFATSVAGQVVTITRQGDGSVEAAGAQTCTIAGIVNPAVSGSAGTYSLQTKTAADAVIDQALSVAADTIVAAALTGTDVEPASLVAGATSTATVSFTTVNPLATDGKITVTFPAGFDVSGAASGTCTSMDGTFATSVAGQVVTITRQGDGSIEAAGAQTCTIAGIVNPAVSGSAGTYALRTLDAVDAVIDEALAVAADTIAASALAATDVAHSSLVVGSTVTTSMAFTTINPLPADGKVTLTFPAGFDVSGAASGTCSSMDGTFATSVAGQVVTITRQGDGSVEAAGVQACTVGTIVLPAAAGATGTYALRTTNNAGVAIGVDLAVAGDTTTSGGGGGGGGGSGSSSGGGGGGSPGAGPSLSTDDSSVTSSDDASSAVTSADTDTDDAGASGGSGRTYTFRVGIDARIAWFNLVRVTFPDGYGASVEDTECRVLEPAGLLLEEVQIPTPTRIVCDVGRVDRLVRGSVLAFEVSHIRPPEGAVTGDVVVEFVTHGGAVRGLVRIPLAPPEPLDAMEVELEPEEGGGDLLPDVLPGEEPAEDPDAEAGEHEGAADSGAPGASRDRDGAERDGAERDGAPSRRVTPGVGVWMLVGLVLLAGQWVRTRPW